MPTTLGRVPYIRTGNTEENRRLAGIRKRLMKTHALVESMMEREWKERYDTVVLEGRVRDAKRNRGEEVEELNGLTCGGDYEEIMGQDDAVLRPRVVPLRDRKWVLSDAILLFGSYDEVSTHLPREGGWTCPLYEKERKDLFKSLDAASRSTANKLYIAFSLLYRAVNILELSRILPEMSEWMVEYAKKRELKVKGIPREGKEFTLSLINHQDLKKCPDLHKIRQYASLSSAIIYLSAKRNGKGRTLTEICEAFGTVSSGGKEDALVRPKFCSKAMGELRSVLPGVVAGKAASAASSVATMSSSSSAVAASTSAVQNPMTTPIKSESRTSFNDAAPSIVSLSSTTSLAPISDMSNHNIVNDDSSVNTSIVPSSETEALADLTSRLASSLNLPQCAIAAAVSIAVQCSNDATVSTPTPTKSTRQIRPPIRRGKGNSSLFIKSRGVKRPSGISAVLKQEGSSDLIAAASILLICMAGQKMQTLARQAVNNSNENNNLSTKSEEILQQQYESMDDIASLSNPLDDLTDEISSCNQPPEIESSKTSSLTLLNTSPKKPPPIKSWTAWNHQPPWHREVSQIEKCSGVSSKNIISYYSNVLHPRRSHFLDVARKRLGEPIDCNYQISHPSKRIKLENNTTENRPSDTSPPSLLQNITVASPLISIRDL